MGWVFTILVEIYSYTSVWDELTYIWSVRLISSFCRLWDMQPLRRLPNLTEKKKTVLICRVKFEVGKTRPQGVTCKNRVHVALRIYWTGRFMVVLSVSLRWVVFLNTIGISIDSGPEMLTYHKDALRWANWHRTVSLSPPATTFFL